jgi:hypothetical protein
MYAPVRNTLISGFKALGIEPIFQSGLKPEFQPKRGDVFIWIGVADAAKVDFKALSEKGVYTVYYQSETEIFVKQHGEVCQFFTQPGLDEIWDFSHQNIDICGDHPGAPGILRYVPLGALASSPTVRQAPKEIAKITMFGSGTSFGRADCFMAIQQSDPLMNERLMLEEKVWSDQAFSSYLNQTDVGIFVNFHKSDCKERCRVDSKSGKRICNEFLGPVTFRNALLLNAHGLIISEQCYFKDEAEYNGTMSFVGFNDIHKEFIRLLELGLEDRQLLADTRAALFARKFEPRTIFINAGICSLLIAKGFLRNAVGICALSKHQI